LLFAVFHAESEPAVRIYKFLHLEANIKTNRPNKQHVFTPSVWMKELRPGTSQIGFCANSCIHILILYSIVYSIVYVCCHEGVIHKICLIGVFEIGTVVLSVIELCVFVLCWFFSFIFVYTYQ